MGNVVLMLLLLLLLLVYSAVIPLVLTAKERSVRCVFVSDRRRGRNGGSLKKGVAGHKERNRAGE